MIGKQTILIKGDKMQYKKYIKVSKQGGTSITIPKQICEMFEIVPGEYLELIVNFDEDIKQIKLRKINNN